MRIDDLRVGLSFDDVEIDREEARRLRRSVLAEVVFAAVVLAVTALLVNTAPARTESSEPVTLTMRSGGVFADVGNLWADAATVDLLALRLNAMFEDSESFRDFVEIERYLDLIVNDEVRRNFELRAKIISNLRQQLDTLGNARLGRVAPETAHRAGLTQRHPALGIEDARRVDVAPRQGRAAP